MSKINKVKVDEVLPELNSFPDVYVLSVSYGRKVRESHSEPEIIKHRLTASSHRLSLERLQSRLELMNRREFVKLLEKIGYDSDPAFTYVYSRPDFDIQLVQCS
jgi:hypothetical protein